MPVLPDHEVERVLVVISHPDDAEFWAAGTIAQWTDAEIAVTYCVLTDGDMGGADPAVSRSDIPRIRRREQQAAAGILGVKDVRFLGMPEGEVQGNASLRRELVCLVREIRPQRLVTWSPEWNWQRFRVCHPDHLATGAIALHAVYPDAENPFAHLPLREREGLDTWTVPEIWLLNSPHPNHYVDITEVFARKVTAVRAHKSQVEHRQDLAGRLRQRSASVAATAGFEEGCLAEDFQVVQNK